MRQGWHLYDTILSDPRIRLAGEPDNVEQQWRNYTDVDSLSPKLSSDAYVAAFARAANFRLVTFDQAFRQFGDVSCLIL